jgi:hypothetical protein
MFWPPAVTVRAASVPGDDPAAAAERQRRSARAADLNHRMGHVHPHSGASWPRSRDILARHMKGVPEERRRMILHDNVRALYNLPVD